MFPPGAPRSGFSDRSGDSPHELVVEMRFPDELGTVMIASVHVIIVVPAAMRPSISAPSVAVMATTGIVIGTMPATVGERVPGTLL